MATMTITVDVGDEHDPTLVDPHEVAEDVLEVYRLHHRANPQTSYGMVFVAAEWDEP